MRASSAALRPCLRLFCVERRGDSDAFARYAFATQLPKDLEIRL